VGGRWGTSSGSLGRMLRWRRACATSWHSQIVTSCQLAAQCTACPSMRAASWKQVTRWELLGKVTRKQALSTSSPSPFATLWTVFVGARTGGCVSSNESLGSHQLCYGRRCPEYYSNRVEHSYTGRYSRANTGRKRKGHCSRLYKSCMPVHASLHVWLHSRHFNC
jgi:hypothetical protein